MKGSMLTGSRGSEDPRRASTLGTPPLPLSFPPPPAGEATSRADRGEPEPSLIPCVFLLLLHNAFVPREMESLQGPGTPQTPPSPGIRARLGWWQGLPSLGKQGL